MLANTVDFQPCNSKMLATHKVVVDSFRNLYPLNHNATAPKAVLVGRYQEDVYYGGNPWPICTLGCAEFLYDAAAQFDKAGQIVIDQYSLAFFQDLWPKAQKQTYKGYAVKKITSAMRTYADGFVSAVEVSIYMLLDDRDLTVADVSSSKRQYIRTVQQDNRRVNISIQADMVVCIFRNNGTTTSRTVSSILGRRI